MIVDKEEFKSLIISGKTIPELQEHYSCSRSTIMRYKKEMDLVGLSPNSKKLDRPSGVKICTSCGEGKSLEDFYTNGYSPLGKIKYKGKCKECEQQVKYEKFSNLLKDYLNISNRKYACESCGYTNIFGALDWHHINPNNKDFNISDIPKTISSENFITNVMPELDKCKLLCPNCHRLEHIFMGRK